MTSVRSSPRASAGPSLRRCLFRRSHVECHCPVAAAARCDWVALARRLTTRQPGRRRRAGEGTLPRPIDLPKTGHPRHRSLRRPAASALGTGHGCRNRLFDLSEVGPALIGHLSASRGGRWCEDLPTTSPSPSASPGAGRPGCRPSVVSLHGF